ncbi:MAG: hypothetical protein ACJ73S_23245, partial [Mycobacteriales bacterium]
MPAKHRTARRPARMRGQRHPYGARPTHRPPHPPPAPPTARPSRQPAAPPPRAAANWPRRRR